MRARSLDWTSVNPPPNGFLMDEWDGSLLEWLLGKVETQILEAEKPIFDLSFMIYQLSDFGQITYPLCAFLRARTQEGLNVIVGVEYLVAPGRCPPNRCSFSPRPPV